MCNKTWKGERWSEKWKEEVMVPIIKKRKRWKIAERVTLMQSTYKVYTAVLAERLRRG